MEEKSEKKALEIFKNRPQALWRTDLFSLAICEFTVDQGDKGEQLDVDDAKDLFWNFYSPQWVFPRDNKSKTVPDLSADELELVAETLEKLEIATRVPYEPDVEDNYDKLLIYLHIAACRALLLKKRDGYSEDVSQLLEESWSVWRRFIGGEILSFEPGEMKDNEWWRSSASVTALVLVELFRIRRKEGDYEKALHLFALALGYASYILFDAFGEELIETWRLKYEKYIPKIDANAQEAVAAFENLRASNRKKDWRQIAADCRMISQCWGDCLGNDEEFRNPEEIVTDRDGLEWAWLSFWEHARGYAEAKLEPSDLLDEMKKAEDERAQQRLRVYFFDNEAWSLLSERARKSLIEAERAYHSTGVGIFEDVPNQLRKATEEILYSTFWVPLSQQKITDTRLLDFQKIREKLSRKHQEPSLVHFEDMLKTYAFKQFFNSQPMSEEDRDFVLKQLHKSLRNLREVRVDLEHKIGYTYVRKQVAPFFKEFLGIGCKGILPRLLEIRKKIPDSKMKKGVSTQPLGEAGKIK